ncbi:MAG TPA: hypothetical protein DIT67_03290 [Octadecabacter sp.]|nr:hypothetical protein [Octadecabacter sp.]
MSLEEIQAKNERGELRPNKAPSEQSPELPDGFWDDSELVLPQVKQAISLRVDPEVLDYFRAQGKGHLTRMHAVLKSYVEAQKARDQD